ncbi:hypothetical protein NPIL_104991 [Nephila pilipes]|uniref:Uncharacterized protein n=1 Tax=Nephila pilipes TaxID=299642 RepID=A0A8X6N5B1_NEPPI|nr:hypothetical protein NPIL_104991 [Nephila pilipes]
MNEKKKQPVVCKMPLYECHMLTSHLQLQFVSEMDRLLAATKEKRRWYAINREPSIHEKPKLSAETIFLCDEDDPEL